MHIISTSTDPSYVKIVRYNLKISRRRSILIIY
jgi:hypothetical protein